jgi:hypothetical protein
MLHFFTDYKLYSDVLGKRSRSGHYCPFCKVNKRERVQRTVGVKWTCENMKQTYDLRSEDISNNRGVVEECLLPSIEPSNFLFAVLHQLLGTGNDMRERIYKMADEIFETWPPET